MPYVLLLTKLCWSKASVHLDFVGTLARFPQIALHLHPQPGIGGTAEDVLQPDSHIRRNSRMSIEQIGQRFARDAKGLCRRGDSKAERLPGRSRRDAPGCAFPSRYLLSGGLVVIDQIDVDRVLIFELEHQPPIA
jgi:hypothetical protein